MESLKSEINFLVSKLSVRCGNLPEGQIHPMDADLILDLLRQLYEKTEQLRGMPVTGTPVPETNASANASVATATPMPDPLPVETPVPMAEASPSPVIASGPDLHPEPARPDSSGTETAPARETFTPSGSGFKAADEFDRDPGPGVKPEAAVQKDLFGSPTIADKLKNDTPSLNDRITNGRNDLTLADQMKLQPIPDLKTAIGLNDKFQFINDLFEGSSDNYTEALNRLNACSGSFEAKTLFSELKNRYNWDAESSAFSKLYEFVVRRYL